MALGAALLCLSVPTAAAVGAPPSIRSRDDVPRLLDTALPADALEIAEAMKVAKVGERLVVRGTVARSKDAFVSNRTVFTLVDESTSLRCCPPSATLPDTACDIPATGRATIQIVDDKGRPLRFGLDGVAGLAVGAEVFVTGTVQSANGKDLLVLGVESMHVPKAPLPQGFFLMEPPAAIVDVSAARQGGALKAGDTVVLRGRIGGSQSPFVEGRAVFTLVGRGIKACSDVPGDRCPRPWDYCCATREEVLANSVTVQVVDEKGQPMRSGMKGRRGMKELSELVVVGKVSAVSGQGVVVDATGMWVGR